MNAFMAAGPDMWQAVIARLQDQTAFKRGLDEATLQAFIKPLLTAYKRPSRIEFMEPLPTAPSGKVLKHKLKKEIVR